MTCKHCGEHICDTCWQKRADILIERDDLSTEVARLRGQMEIARAFVGMLQRTQAPSVAELAKQCEAALASPVARRA